MAVSIFDENAPHDGSTFTPFDESKAGKIQRAAVESTITDRLGINTTGIDEFRQGIELTTQTHRLKGLGAKIWAGNTEGYVTIRTFGQALPFAEYEGSIAFEELPKFNPVGYMQNGPAYPLPIIFNDGPQQNKETSLQPFTIPYRSANSDIDGIEKPRSIKSSLEDGNQDGRFIAGRTSRIEQFVSYTPASLEPFLDEGSEYVGDTADGSILIEGFVWDGENCITPYDDASMDEIVTQLNTNDADIIRVLTSVDSQMNLDEDLREVNGRASATAGTMVYGGSAAQYGTDSIAYAGRVRGS